MAGPMGHQTPLIVAEHLTKTFPLPDGKGTFTVLKDVSVTIHAGEVVALLGRSGSGKSTLLRMLAGLIPPSDGIVKNGDQVVIGANPHVAMVFQSFALLPWTTCSRSSMPPSCWAWRALNRGICWSHRSDENLLRQIYSMPKSSSGSKYWRMCPLSRRSIRHCIRRTIM